MSDDLVLDEYMVPPEGKNQPRAIFERLVRTCREFSHLNDGEPAVEFLLRNSPKMKAGRDVLGSCHMPTVQGELRTMFEWLMLRQFGYVPDFLVILDRAWWAEASDQDREILIFHEAMHMDQKTNQYGEPLFDKETGRPIWKLRGHDVEEFIATVRRYGAYSGEIQEFIRAASGMSQSM